MNKEKHHVFKEMSDAGFPSPQTASSGSLSFLLYEMRYYLCLASECDDYCLYNALKLS